MVDLSTINPKRTAWKHANNIAHGCPCPSSNRLNEYKEPLNKEIQNHVSFSGSKFLGIQGAIKPIAQQFSVVEKKSSLEAYNQIKEYLDEPVKLAFEKAIKSYGKESPEIFISKPIYYRFAEALKTPFNNIKNGIKYLLSNSQTKAALKEKCVAARIIGNLEEAYKNITAIGGKPEEIKKVISDSLTKKLGTVRSNYSVNTSSASVRVIAGILGGIFVANDFCNLRRLIDDNSGEAKKEWKSKFKQALAGIALSAYLGYLTNTTFKQAVNSSLKFAVGLNAVNLVVTEIIIRKIMGKPVLPIKDAELKDSNHQNSSPNPLNPVVSKTIAFSANNGLKNQPLNNITKNTAPISFTGGTPQKIIETIQTIPREKFVNLMKLLEKIDKTRYDKVIDTMQKGIEKLAEYNGKDIKQIIENNAFPEISKIPIGKNGLYNFAVRVMDFIALPVKPVIKLVAKLLQKNTIQADKGQELSSIFVKNSLNLIENAAKTGAKGIPENELIQKMTVDSSLANKVKETYGTFLTDLLGTNKASYDISKASTLFKLTGMTIVPFLAMDAYNVSKKESKDGDLALQKGKQRIVQDLTRQTFSTWIVAGCNSIFKEFINKSIWGLTAITAGNVLLYESLTRLSTGSPILTKTKSELEEIEANNFSKKGFSASCFRFMSRITGRKQYSENIRINKKYKTAQEKLYNSVMAKNPEAKLNNNPQFSKKYN